MTVIRAMMPFNQPGSLLSCRMPGRSKPMTATRTGRATPSKFERCMSEVLELVLGDALVVDVEVAMWPESIVDGHITDIAEIAPHECPILRAVQVNWPFL
jgi:hypothetical protein